MSKDPEEQEEGDNAEYVLQLPFLDSSSRYCRGVELGLEVLAPMFLRQRVIKGYFHTLNEEQVRLACYRLDYELLRCEPWHHEGKRTGWVYMVMRRRRKRKQRRKRGAGA